VKYPKLPCAIALLMACGSDRAIARPTTWNDYTNVRFAYRACYPNWLRAGRESDDGDGRIFTDKFGGEMRVWMDDTEITDIHMTQLHAEPPFAGVEYGFESSLDATTPPFNFWIDEIVVNDTRIGCTN